MRTKNQFKDTCRMEGRMAISENLLTPLEQSRKNYERLAYERMLWKRQKQQQKDEELASLFDAVGSLLVAIIAVCAMVYLMSIIS